MISLPGEWIQHFGVDLTVAYPAEGGVRFRYQHRLRPSPSFSEIVGSILASDPEFRVNAVSEMVRAVTAEGEYGAWIAIQGRRSGVSAMRYIGAVFMDDFATALDAMTNRPDRFREIELLSLEVLKSSRFGMGQRPRRFFYVPPVDWQGVPSGATANWYPPDFPKNRTTIVVPPAQVLEGTDEQAIDEVLARAGAGLELETTARDELTAASGARGVCLRVQGQRAGVRLHREVAVFVVEPRVYWMRFETAMADRLLDLREVFNTVTGSFRPLPGPEEIRLGQAFGSTADVFDHWTI